MEAAHFSETFVYDQKIQWHNIPEDNYLKNQVM
jgi:hypothetical protein